MKFLFWLTALLSNLPARSQELCPPKRDFDTIIRVVEQGFYDPNMRGIAWRSLKENARTNILCDANDISLAKIINSLLDELKTSHTGLYTPKDLKYWALSSIFSGDLNKFEIPFSGVGSINIDGEKFANFVLEGSPAFKAGVRVGDRLDKVDEKDFSDLAFEPKKSSIFRFGQSAENSRQTEIKPRVASMQSHFLSAMKQSRRVIKRGDKVVGYIHLWCGTHEKFLKQLERSLKSFKRSKATHLIIDLRDGYGGASPDYLRLLITDPYLKKIPKYFLINGGVTSGKEWISAIIKRDKLGQLIGSTTAGAFIAGAKHELLDGRFLLYLATREFNPEGIPKLEGSGVSPDILVEPCRKYCHGSDPQLDRALKEVFGDLSK